MEAALTTPSGRISLGTAPLKIGSATSNELTLNDDLAAPFHAEIAPTEGGYQLTDLGSAPGTRVNGQVVFPHTPLLLQNGDTISIGITSLTFEMHTSAEADVTPLTTSIEEMPTERVSSALTQNPQEDRAVNEETPTELITPTPNAAVTEVSPTPAQASATEIFVQAEAPAQAPPASPAAPLYAGVPPSLAPYGQPFPMAMPVQAFSPAGYPLQPGMPIGTMTGALPQPGYTPLPGQFQPIAPTQAAPVPTGKKRSRALLWVVLVIVVLLLLAGSNTATYALTHPQTPKVAVNAPPSPKNTLQTYCQGILTGNSEEIYDLLSTQAKIHTSLDDIQQKFSLLNVLNSSSSSISAKYTDCTFDNIRVSNGLAVATVSLTMSMTMQLKTQNGTVTNTLTESAPSLTSLVWEKNQWKIDYGLMSQPQPTINTNGLSGTPTVLP